MNYTLAKAEYDINTKISTTIIKTDIGEFVGTSFCQEEDREYESQYFGCMIAEWKAVRKYCKAKRSIVMAQISSLQRFMARMSETKSYDKDAFWTKIYSHTLEEYYTELNKWEQNIHNINVAIILEIKKRDAGLAKLYGGNKE